MREPVDSRSISGMSFRRELGERWRPTTLTAWSATPEELRLWRNAYESPVKGWRFSAGDEAGASGKTYDIEPGDFWPEVGIPVRLSTRTNVPEEWAGLPVELELWLGGEGFVEISVGDSRTASGLNPFHRNFLVQDEARGGEEVGIEAEVVSKGMFGSNISEPRSTKTPTASSKRRSPPPAGCGISP